jgi:hypothetical protein
VFFEEGLHKRFLIVRRAVDIAEASARRIVDVVGVSCGIIDSGLGLEDSFARIYLRGAHIRDPGTVVWPCRAENVVFADAAVAIWWRIVAYARVAGGEEEADALKAEFHKFVALPFLVRDWNVNFLAAIGERKDIRWFEDTALELAVVAVWTGVGVLRVDTWSVAAFAIRTVGTVRAVDGIEEGVEAPCVCVIGPGLVVDVVYVPNGDYLRID